MSAAAPGVAPGPAGSAGVGLVLFGHGAREPRWADTMTALAERLGERLPGVPVECAFLEFMTPDLDEAVGRLVARGVGTVVVAPVFLAAGGHVLRDLPRCLDAIAARRPGVTLRAGDALGGLPGVLDAMAAACVGLMTDARAWPAPAAAGPEPPPVQGVDGS
jgi:sirohydrochlorin cobaltochelatase